MKRRDALKTIGGLAGAATLSHVLPGCDDKKDPVGITTYVYMMMENRSFDHFFGSRKLVENIPGVDGPDPNTKLPDINGNLVPLFNPTKDNECDLDPPHGWDPQHASWNSGACDQFLVQHQKDHNNDATATQPLQYLVREQVPVSYALADAYAIANKWFCSVMGPTFPNRVFWFAGTSFGTMGNDLPSSGQFTGASIYHRLEAKGIDYAYYYGSLPVIAAISDIPDIQMKIKRFSQFTADCAAGTLPPVVYIDPAFFDNDDHPPVHPINGQELIETVYRALAASPQWKNILLVITYDENGGFFDHVSPPKTVDDLAAQGFDQLGFRVPTMVIGPYVKEGFVSNVVYDHTSALQHLINVFDLDPLTTRTSAANDLTDFIDMDRLAKGQWHPPVDVPDVNPSDWPMTDACVYHASAIEHPIFDWANAHPELFEGTDLRGEVPEYRRQIKEALKKLRG